ncbi:MAG: OmpA family protein [Bacteroidota bacterium]
MNYPVVKVSFKFPQNFKAVLLIFLGLSLHLSIFAQPEPAAADAQGASRGAGAGTLDTRLSTINYKSGIISLDETAKEELDYVLQLFKLNPNLILAVQGHSDDQGNIGRHNYLSEYRAWLVWAYLVARGVPHHQISYYGFGYRKPKVQGVDTKSRKENRRVEIHVVLPDNPDE